MFKTLLENKSTCPISQKAGTFLLHQVNSYSRQLQEDLDKQIDKRLVRTFFDLLITILLFRDRAMGLLLSELGGYICGPSHAPAGTKRISNLLRSKKWTSKLIDDFLFKRTIDRTSFNAMG